MGFFEKGKWIEGYVKYITIDGHVSYIPELYINDVQDVDLTDLVKRVEHLEQLCLNSEKD